MGLFVVVLFGNEMKYFVVCFGGLVANGNDKCNFIVITLQSLSVST